MSISIDDLPAPYQRQVLEKLEQQKRRPLPQEPAEPATAKYHNEKTAINGITFDSRKEANRYCELMSLLEAGVIFDLRMQEEFLLMGSYTAPTNGVRIRSIKYRADFTYRRCDNPQVKIVEDVKSVATRTREYIMKKKMMHDRLGIDIQEV